MLSCPPPFPATGRAFSRILLVEDHPMVREGMRVLLAGTPDFVVCGEAATPGEALAAVEREHPDIVCLDLVLGSADGFGLIGRIHAIDPEVKILVITAREEETHARRCLEAGARGFAMKTELNDVLVTALRRVAAGGVHLSARMRLSVLEELPDAAPAGRLMRRLTERELQVFKFVGLGWSAREIAERLGIGTKTVESHRENIKNKLGLPHATALARAAILWVKSLH